ncbi:MAG: hypothetical protein FWE74_00050 [Oscillospiraceae bacterium]|nr:hypothetical protein [Oscillospiraceae bacterium]
MHKKKIKIVISVIITAIIFISALIIYIERTRHTTPIISIENNTVSWNTTGTGDIRAGRFIRSYEVRVIIGDETFTTIVDGAKRVDEILSIDLTSMDLSNSQLITENAEVTVRTIRNFNSTRYSKWSNIVIWIRK